MTYPEVVSLDHEHPEHLKQGHLSLSLTTVVRTCTETVGGETDSVSYTLYTIHLFNQCIIHGYTQCHYHNERHNCMSCIHIQAHLFDIENACYSFCIPMHACTRNYTQIITFHSNITCVTSQYQVQILHAHSCIS